MPSQSEHHDVAVVGGGVIGLAVAWRAAQRGLRTARARRGRGRRLALRRRHARAGHRGGVRRATRCSRSACAAPPASRRSAPSCEASGIDPGCAATARWSSRATATRPRSSSGCSSFRARARPRGRAAAPEPGAPRRARARADGPARARRARRRTPSTRAASSPRWRDACERAGGEVRRGRVTAVEPASCRRTTLGAAGAASSSPPAPGAAELGAACRSARSRARSCACATPRGQDLVTRTIRTREGYLVPRGDGRYVLGATVEERGLDTAPTARRHATSCSATSPRSCPACSSSRSRSSAPACAPARPTTCRSSAGAPTALVWATGHYRNGILLADVTAEAVVGRARRRRRCPSGRRRAPGAASREVRRHERAASTASRPSSRRRDGRRPCWRALDLPDAAASRWRSTPRSCRAASGRRTS